MAKARDVRAYGLALLTTAAGAGLQALLNISSHSLPFITFFPVIVINGWNWSLGPALMSVGLCALTTLLLPVPPLSSVSYRTPAGLTLFVLVGALLAFMSARFRQSRTRAESLQHSLVQFLDSTADAFMAFDARWRYVYVNRRAAQFARLTADQMIGRPIFELFPDIRSVPFFEAGERVMRERTPLTIESYYPPLDTWFQNDIYPVGTDGIAVFYRDITERRRAAEMREELLRREQTARSESEAANRLKDEFLATLSHELRTPLNAILGWASLLGQGRLDPLERARAVETIQHNARAQTHLIEDLLDVSRIISGKMRLDVQAVELGPLLEAALDAIRPAAEARDIQLKVSIDPVAAIVNGDPGRLQQIAWNLLSNAIKFTPKGGRVELSLRRVNSQVELAVSDTGIGIAPEMLQRIFDRFAQVDSTSSREYHGLGLGLALVRHLVEAHGGSVWAESEGEGKGATFTVQLPLRFMPEGTITRRKGGPRADTVWPSDRTALLDVDVLIVEDNADARELLTRMATGLGASVRAVGSVADAFGELDRRAPDVILSDLEMPGEDGYTLIRKLRSRPDALGRLPAIAVTAYARIEDRARALREGFDNHIAKPVYVPELAAVISRALASRSSGVESPE